MEKIKTDQQIYMIAPTLRKLDKGRQISMNCFDFKSEDNAQVPKYTLHVVDSNEDKLIKSRKCVCIITPQGREKESIFGTEMGRQKLCSQAQTARLIVVFLGHGHKFESMQEIQDELNSKILELSPENCSNYSSIPIMTAGEDIGKKSLIDVKGQDGIQGFLVQDIKTGESPVLRQVIFEAKYDQIQSEMQLVYRDPKKHEIPQYMLANSALCPKKKGKQAVVNHDVLTNEYQQAQLCGLFMVPSLAQCTELNVLHLGTGAGTVPSFLVSQLGPALKKVTTIDNNADMVKLATKYFGFNPESDKIESKIMDAFDYVTKEPAGQYDAIIIDINFQKDDLSISPPWPFFSQEFFDGLLKHAHPERFYIAMNVLYYDEETKQKVFARMSEGLSGKVDNLAYLEVEEGANKVFVFTKDPAKVDLMDY